MDGCLGASPKASRACVATWRLLASVPISPFASEGSYRAIPRAHVAQVSHLLKRGVVLEDGRGERVKRSDCKPFGALFSCLDVSWIPFVVLPSQSER